MSVYASAVSTTVKSAVGAAIDSVTGASATATTAASRKSAGGLGRSAVARSVRRSEDGKLNGVSLARALGAGDLPLLVDHDLLKARVAIVADVFVDRHVYSSKSQNQLYEFL